MIFFPHAGGSPRFFTHLAAAMPHCRVFGVTYPGRDHLVDAAPVTEMAPLAASIAHELATRFRAGQDDPLILVGHSLGAFVAYETAAVLGTLPAPLQTVVVASGQNPPLRRPLEDPDVPQTDGDIVADVIRQNPASAPIWENPELRSFFLPILRADYELLGSYVPSHSVIEQINIVVADQDTEIDHASMPQWQQVSHQRIEIAVVYGGHFYLNSPDLQLAEHLLHMPTLTNVPEGGRTGDHAVHTSR
ncbi:MAG: thioesterase II family protein [Dermatophilaceae bacterium]